MATSQTIWVGQIQIVCLFPSDDWEVDIKEAKKEQIKKSLKRLKSEEKNLWQFSLADLGRVR